MKLLHTGDLHLDAAFCAYGERGAQMQRKAGRDLLCRIFECAKSEGCEMILIAGDLFDSRFVSPESAELFCKLIENYRIPVILSPGNHDFYTEGGFYAKARARLGELLTVFSSNELQSFDFDELRVRVFGYAFTSPSLNISPLTGAELPEDNGYLKVFCAHADLATPISRYSPLTLAEIEACRFDYVALGHIHNRFEREDSEGRVHYCGFAEGRSFDEIGEGGVWIVDVDRDRCSCERKKLSQKAFFCSELDVSAADSAESLRKIIVGELARFSAVGGAHLRLSLYGRCDEALISLMLASRASLAEEAGVAYLELIDDTLPYFDGEFLERDSTLRGEVYRTLLPKLTSQNAEERRLATRALRIALAAIDGKNIFGAAGQDGGAV